MNIAEIENLSCDEARELLEEVVEALDALDEQDYFGSEGWRRMLLGEI